MLELSSKLLVNSFFVLVFTLLYGKYVSKKLKIDIKVVFLIFLAILLITTMSFKINKLAELSFKYITLLFLFKILYKESFSKTIICTFLMYIMLIFGELLFSIIVVLILQIDQDFLKQTIEGYLFSNFLILFFMIILANNKKISKILNEIIDWYINKQVFYAAFLTTLGMIITCYLLYKNYLKIKSVSSFTLTSIFLFGILVFIVGFFKEKTNNSKLISEYDQLLDYVKTYEEVIEEKSKNQHEYNNQLILIREMLGTRNKKVKEYIDQILSIENEQSKGNWLNKIKNIPNGGLKGLIHYKIVEMEKKKIKLYIDINENVNNKKTNKYLRDNLNDISKIIGVYLDNAREAALKSKEKYIIIEAECNKDKLNFSISNTYKGGINLSKIDNAGYSKKGKSRGYGLSLVHDIINRRNDVEQYREFNGIYFVQHVCLKYKK